MHVIHTVYTDKVYKHSSLTIVASTLLILLLLILRLFSCWCCGLCRRWRYGLGLSVKGKLLPGGRQVKFSELLNIRVVLILSVAATI